MEKKIAKKGKVLYCKELDRYCTATTDTLHEWVEVDEKEKENNGK